MKLNKYFLIPSILFLLFIVSCQTEKPKTVEQVLNAPLFEFQNIEPRWNSFENPTSAKGKGGQENKGAKGHPYDFLKAGESKVLMEVQGSELLTWEPGERVSRRSGILS